MINGTSTRNSALGHPTKARVFARRSLPRLLPALVAAAALALVAGATPAQALTACGIATPCLPENEGFISQVPALSTVLFNGSVAGNATLSGMNGVGGTNPGTAGLRGVYAGPGRGSGVIGQLSLTTADNVAGVFGVLTQANAGTDAAGVRGEQTATSANGIGVLGLHAGSGIGVEGRAPDGIGVLGVHTSATGLQAGVQGTTNSNADMANGVRGIANGNSASSTGVYGTSAYGIGVVGFGPTAGLLGYSPNGLAGLFLGNVHVQGTLSKSAGSFRIDHPLDPTHMYLQHSFVESPDMKNVYDGVVTTDRRGLATVKLPRYFQALNRTFRYQLTIVGRSFARAIVWKEIAANRFTIKTDRPRVKVSWQVTGIRKDPYANAHRIQPELRKPANEQGTYLAPELYGQPRSESTFDAPVRTAK
jgi:hypothetical protein